ncbi:DUF402 domain-containing protein [Desulfurococcus amylolyticus]|uniref:DUF402 domain-containing protein n=1 Tax=Desulfurococcus amylolyticus TaxID=94694 RepID=UPI001F410923|nr:DUF402 domain-containing protein [Desulfurococcus amylolyticus]
MAALAKVRIRGIYATALTKLLMDKGHSIVQPSEKIASRFNIGIDNSPSDVTVKDKDDGDGVVVIGFPSEAREIYNDIVSAIPYTFRSISQVELHSIYLARVEKNTGDTCIVDTGDFKTELTPCREKPGDKVIVGVAKTALYPGEKISVTRSFRLLGKLVALIHGMQKVTFSEHIRDPGLKARLTALAVSRLMGGNLGVHFRSSARFAEPSEILGEIEFLLNEYKRVMSKASEADAPLKLYRGELVGVIGFTSLSKNILDDIRGTVTPTIRGHHSLRSMGLGDIVEAMEHCIVNGCSGDSVSRCIWEYVLVRLAESGVIHIRHVKPTGEALDLTPGRIHRIERSVEGVRVIIKRIISGSGLYDGIGVERKPGDLDYMVVEPGKPYIVHNYYRDTTWLGSYINVNTPPELSVNIVKYHDLLVDVAVAPGREPIVLDRDELEKTFSAGLIDPQLYEYALKTLEEIARDPARYLYNP